MNKLHTQGKARNRIEDGQIKVIVGGQTVSIAYGQENADFITNCYNVTNEFGSTPMELLESVNDLKLLSESRLAVIHLGNKVVAGFKKENAELLEQRKEAIEQIENLLWNFDGKGAPSLVQQKGLVYAREFVKKAKGNQ